MFAWLDEGGLEMKDLILEIPKWSGQITFSREAVWFLLTIFAWIVGFFICILGYKYLQTLVLIVLGMLCGGLGVWIGDQMTDNTLLQLSFFVMFTFLGVCLLYLLSILWTWGLKKVKLYDACWRGRCYTAALVGALVVAGVLYFRIYRNGVVALVLFALSFVASVIHGKRQAAKQKPFYTYEDLLRVTRPDEIEEKANA